MRFRNGPAFYEQFKKLYGEASPEYSSIQVRPGSIFAIKKQPPLQQPLLVRLASVDDLNSEKVVLDPNQLDPSGGTAIDFFVPSLDGKRIAVSISKGGSERGDLYIYDVETCQPLKDVYYSQSNSYRGRQFCVDRTWR